jgi:hypothetical protein
MTSLTIRRTVSAEARACERHFPLVSSSLFAAVAAVNVASVVAMLLAA